MNISIVRHIGETYGTNFREQNNERQETALIHLAKSAVEYSNIRTWHFISNCLKEFYGDMGPDYLDLVDKEGNTLRSLITQCHKPDLFEGALSHFDDSPKCYRK